MKTIYKYALTTNDKQVITVPYLQNEDGEIVLFKDQVLKVNVQHEQLFMWCLVDDSMEFKCDRNIYIYGTGHPINSDFSKKNYIGTYQLMNGNFIGHVFIE